MKIYEVPDPPSFGYGGYPQFQQQRPYKAKKNSIKTAFRQLQDAIQTAQELGQWIEMQKKAAGGGDKPKEDPRQIMLGRIEWFFWLTILGPWVGLLQVYALGKWTTIFQALAK